MEMDSAMIIRVLQDINITKQLNYAIWVAVLITVILALKMDYVMYVQMDMV